MQIVEVVVLVTVETVSVLFVIVTPPDVSV